MQFYNVIREFVLTLGLCEPEIEASAPKENNKKKIYRFDESEARIRDTGLRRHLRPVEAFSEIFSGTSIGKDMLEDSGEWLSLAFERTGESVTLYLDPKGIKWCGEGIEWGGGKYTVSDKISYSKKYSFSIPEKSLQVMQCPKNLVSLLYGHHFDDFPEEVKTAKIYFPLDGIWPVCRGSNNVSYNLYCAYLAASRGTR